MKKIFGIALTWILFSTVSIAQVATTTAKESVDKKECVPTKECAAKYGMTLEECKKICTGKTAATASTEEGTSKVASASKVSDVTSGKKACCASKAGATAGTCTKSKTATTEAGTTKVAAAAMVNEVEAVTDEKVKAKKSCKATCIYIGD